MNDFQTIVTAEDAAPDPSKHVNYVQGMVLGVADFTQEFAFLNGRIEWLAREAIGYGALSGLRVTVEQTGDGPRVRVAAGVALTPRGELVCVPEDQCALINPWLAEHHDDLPPGLDQTLYVQLCYKTCATDNLPIPGEPCRDEDELMAPSRIADDFCLKLTTTPPDQREDDDVRAFVAWLRDVRLTNDPDVATSEAAFAEAVRGWVASPLGSPPTTLFIPIDRQSDYLRLALRIWATELRPDVRAPGGGCATPPAEGCIALAALDVRLTLDRLESLDLPDVRDERAPFLLHLRMLQELLIAGRRDALPSDTVRDETAYGLAPDAGISEEYSRADHTHGTPPLPELVGDVDSFPAPPDSFPSFPDAPDHRIWTTVVAIQGTPVAPEPPTEAGQPLVFDGNVWHPGPVPASIEPGDSVVAERSYGLASAAGAALPYARADHTHGTPPPPELVGEVIVTSAAEAGTVFQMETRVARIYDEAVGVPAGPAPVAGQVLKLFATGGALEWRPGDDNAGTGGPAAGTTVVAERSYGLASAAGAALPYSPADHTHGTPPAPTFTGEVAIQVAQSTATVQQYQTRVAEILTLPVASAPAPAPVAGDILTLVEPAGSPGKLEWQIGSRGAGGSFVVAAGQFAFDGTTVFAHNGLQATQLIPALPTVYLLSFAEFDPTGHYVVTGTPWTNLDDQIPAVFEYIGDSRDDKIRSQLETSAANNPALKEIIAKFGIEKAGILVRVRHIDNKPISKGFMVEISQY